MANLSPKQLAFLPFFFGYEIFDELTTEFFPKTIYINKDAKEKICKEYIDKFLPIEEDTWNEIYENLSPKAKFIADNRGLESYDSLI